jgi:hypothetical protein
MKEAGAGDSYMSDERTYRTVNGRPLLELNTPKFILSTLRSEGVLFEEARAHYPDSRKGHPDKTINVSALHEVREHRYEMFNGLSWIHHNYFGEKVTNMNAEQLEKLSRIPLDLPSFLVKRKTDPIPPDELPDIIGNMYKASAGINATAASMKNALFDEVIVDPENVYAFANTHELLIDKEKGRICAAAKELIIPAIKGLFGRNDDETTNTKLDNLVPNFALLAQYSKLCNDFEIAMNEMVKLREQETKANADINVIKQKKNTIKIRALAILKIRDAILES